MQTRFENSEYARDNVKREENLSFGQKDARMLVYSIDKKSEALYSHYPLAGTTFLFVTFNRSSIKGSNLIIIKLSRVASSALESCYG